MREVYVSPDSRAEPVKYCRAVLSELLSGIDLAETPGYTVGFLASEAEPDFYFGGRCTRGGHPITADTMWETASLSKPVVALMAIDGLAHDPEQLTRPLVTNADAFGANADTRWSELTLFQLLTHSSGLPNWRSPGEPLTFESDLGSPGYSGEGYELLLTELSARSNVPAGTLLEQHLRRLEMMASSFTPTFDRDANVAIGHSESGDPFSKQTFDVPKASGSLHATAADYMRLLAAIARPEAVADPAMQDAAKRIAERSSETIPGYGRTLGWAYNTTELGNVLWQHGDNPGFKHVAAVRPATGQAVLVFTNGDAGQPMYRQVCKRALQVDVW